MGHHVFVDPALPDDVYKREAYQRYLKKYLRSVRGVDDNIAAPAEMQGRSFRPMLEGRPAPTDWRTGIYYRYWAHMAHHDNPAHYGIRTADHKLIFFYGLPLDAAGAMTKATTPGWELYDLRKDPHETKNVHADPAYAATAAKLKTDLLRLKSDLGDTDEKYPELMKARELHWKQIPWSDRIPAIAWPSSLLASPSARRLWPCHPTRFEPTGHIRPNAGRNKKVSWPEARSAEDNRHFDYVIKRYQAFSNIVWDISKEAAGFGHGWIFCQPLEWFDSVGSQRIAGDRSDVGRGSTRT